MNAKGANFTISAIAAGLRLASLCLLVTLSSLIASAATAADYKDRVDASLAIVDNLLLDSDNLDSASARTAVDTVRQNIPASERVEWPGGSVETNNGWLAAKADEFNGAKQEKGRVAALTEISERLAAISQLTGERLQAQMDQSTKNDEKQKLNEILGREEYQKPKVPEESLFELWYRKFMEWLSGSIPKAPDTSSRPAIDFSVVQILLQVLIFGAVIALLGFLLSRLLPVLSRRFASRERSEKEDRVIFGERIADDQSSSDLFREAERLAAAGDLRAAIRKGYIALLCDLSDRRILRLSRHKTNRDYLRDARSHDDVYANIQRLTHVFESNWYGLQPAEQADWEAFKIGYKEAVAAAGRR